MIRRKNAKNFLSLLLIFAVCAVLSGNSPQFAPVAAAETSATTEPGDSAENPPSNDNIYALGGLRPTAEIMSRAVFVHNTTSNATVYSKNADARIPPTSTAKIMTALVAFEREKDLNKTMETPYDCFNEFSSGDPNKSGIADAALVPNQDNLSLRDALYGMMLRSGCDAANVIAYNVGGGSIEAFVAMMNDKAAAIGCENTNFTNAHGLYEPGGYTTAEDMFKIVSYALDKYPRVFGDLVSAEEYTMPPNSANPNGYTLMNTNWLIRDSAENPYFYPYASGIKTGGLDVIHTRKEGGGWESSPGLANLVSIAKKENQEYIIVTLEAPWYPSSSQTAGQRSLHHAFNDHIALYDWAFASFEYSRVLRKTTPICSIRVTNGTVDELTLYPQITDDYWALLPANLDIDSAIERVPVLDSPEVEAPVLPGTVLGTVELRLANRTLEKWVLINVEGVEQTPQAKVSGQLTALFGQPWFVPAAVAVAALIVAAIIFNYVRLHKKRNTSHRRRPPNNRIRR